VNNNVFEYKEHQGPSKLTYIYSGRFVKEKGMYELADYFNYLEEENIDYKAILVGEGELKEIFTQKNVELVGTLSQKDLKQYYKSAINIMLSHFEGMPLSLLEALYSGLPSITSKAGEMKNIINGSNGYLVEKTDYAKILQYSNMIMNKYDFYSKNAHQSVNAYTLETICARYKEVFYEES
jgi:glycosyltransferase involved in cell wall biosynthesis